MTYDALEISKFIIAYWHKHDADITNLMLQKLLYLLWTDYYRTTRQELFHNMFLAWKFGPVVPDAYYNYCLWGGRQIGADEPFWKSTGTGSDVGSNLLTADEHLLSGILSQYLSFSVTDLVRLTTRDGTPWRQVYQERGGPHQKIPFQLIKQSISS